jgi:tRNA pseudouridine13 synthase
MTTRVSSRLRAVAANPKGRLLAGPAHFLVIEEPAYAPSGSGEHLYVEIEKEGLTTDEVAVALARACDVKAVDVGCAGRKDRHAITRQWFSVRSGTEAHLSNLRTAFAKGRLLVLNASRHGNKLRVGHLRGNRFRLGLGEVADLVQLQAALDTLARHGIANRFGPQRFGLGGANLLVARAWGGGDHAAAIQRVVDPSGAWTIGMPLPARFRLGPEGRAMAALRRGADPAEALNQADELRKLIASAAQAAIFNAVLDARAEAGLAHRLRTGDIACTRDGIPFTVTAADLDDVNRRAAPGELDALYTGPLPGTMRLQPSDAVLAEERAWSAGTGLDWSWFADGGTFESPGGRRQLHVGFRSPPQITVEGAITWVSFALPPGSFASEVLAQVGVVMPADRSGAGSAAAS